MSALPLSALLPLRVVVLNFEFLRDSHLPFFHQPALCAFLRSLSQAGETFADGFRIDAVESGRVFYRSGEYYRCVITILPGAEALADDLLLQLSRLPRSAPRTGKKLPFSNNLQLHSVSDAFSEAPVQSFDELSAYAD